MSIVAVEEIVGRREESFSRKQLAMDHLSTEIARKALGQVHASNKIAQIVQANFL